VLKNEIPRANLEKDTYDKAFWKQLGKLVLKMKYPSATNQHNGGVIIHLAQSIFE
jgi:hypothetical protein